MEKINFIYFDDVKKLLLQNDFFGNITKRIDKYKIIYYFKSFKWNDMNIQIHTIKLNPQEIQSKKIVNNIIINDKEINSYEEFINIIDNLYQIYQNKKKKKIKSIKKNI